MHEHTPVTHTHTHTCYTNTHKPDTHTHLNLLSMFQVWSGGHVTFLPLHFLPARTVAEHKVLHFAGAAAGSLNAATLYSARDGGAGDAMAQ